MPQTCPNNIIRTHLVSFPRSGHHLLVRGLTEALDHKLVYSEYYSCVHNLANCKYVNLQKNHDFNDEPIEPEGNYIVMIRGFEHAVASWYKSSVRDISFEEFRFSQKPYYNEFKRKWVRSDMNNRLLINYQHFIEHKIAVVTAAARHMGYEANQAKLKDWEKREAVKVT